MDRNDWIKVVLSLLACCLIAPFEVKAGPVSITFQSLILFIVAAYLGPRWGGIVLLSYLALGALGLPVFADFRSGYEKLIGPTAGFLWGFPLAGIYLGWRCKTGEQHVFYYLIYFFQTHILLLIPGFVVLYFQYEGVNIWRTLVGLLPGLLIKTAVGGVVAYYLQQKFPFGTPPTTR